MKKMTRQAWTFYCLSEVLLALGTLILLAVFSDAIVFKMLWSREASAILAPVAEVGFIFLLLLATWCYERSLALDTGRLRRFVRVIKGLMVLILVVFIALKYLPSPVSQLQASTIWYLELALMIESVYFALALAKTKKA